MKLTVELSPEEFEQAEQQGSLIIVLDRIELQQGLFSQEHRIRSLESVSRMHFTQPVRLPPDRDPLPESNGPWLKVWLGPLQKEPVDGDAGANGDSPG